MIFSNKLAFDYLSFFYLRFNIFMEFYSFFSLFGHNIVYLGILRIRLLFFQMLENKNKI